ncbi:UDP-sugar transporter UST74c isoform X1 [Schistocerca piceifrons]|uniref:UDP-sugar transporter UST74c isoform X1 n=2 Tax=Schistocerca piceifrons TaxID=274613 RepID=UPI001F5F9F1E|nr:UDP-sugar transporter UST74c isoform X1 [Schistocerca piceifrons]
MTQCLQGMGLPNSETTEPTTALVRRIGSAVLYGACSFLITVVNKNVLTTYGFPSAQVLGLGQMAATVAVLIVARSINVLSFPPFDRGIFRKLWPLPLIYMGNVVFGLYGTKQLSLPMLTVLRRFSILMTMVGEFYLLGVRPTTAVQISVYTMILGAIIAASNDLAFSAEGYISVLLNDFFTAANGVVVKQKLDAAELGKYGLMFYNSLFMLPPATVFAWATGELDRAIAFSDWDQPLFLVQFAASCVMGFVLTYSVMLCTMYNSALTTTVIGCLKNVCITYLGMVIGGDYIFSWLNFIGINVSVIGSLVYTWVTFRRKPRQEPKSNAAVTTVV